MTVCCLDGEDCGAEVLVFEQPLGSGGEGSSRVARATSFPQHSAVR
jgi:hypothetical protein